MSEELLIRIQELDNFQVVRFYQYFAQELFNAIDVDLNELLSQIPEQIKETPEIASILSLTGPVSETILSFDDSVVCARKSLTALARQSGSQEALGQMLEEYRDDALTIKAAVNVGLVASMIIIATCGCKLNYVSPDKTLSLTISKPSASTEMVETAAKVVRDLTPAAAIIGVIPI